MSYIDELRKKYTKSIITANQVDTAVPYFPTGILSLDWWCLGIGGIPRRRITTIWGAESSGKSTLALQIIKQAQKLLDGPILYVDAERALDLAYITKLGIDLNKLEIYPNPDSDKIIYGEELIEFTLDAIEQGAPLVIFDSLAVIEPKAAMEGKITDANMGLQARLQSRFMRQVSAIIRPKNSTLVIVNHRKVPYQSSMMMDEQKGADALKFAHSTSIFLISGGALKIIHSDDEEEDKKEKESDTKQKIGKAVHVIITKHKVASPFRRTKLNLLNNIGFDVWADMLNIALDYNIIYRVKEDKKGVTKYKSGRKLFYEDQISPALSFSSADIGSQFRDYVLSLPKELQGKMYNQCIETLKKL